MKMHTFLAGVAVGSGLMLLAATSSFSAQDPPEMSPEMMEQMKQMEEAMAKYTMPTDEHAALAARVGDWSVDGHFWMAPGTEPMPFAAESHFEMLMDGRYLLESLESEFMGETFEGAGLTGYDRIGKQYQSIWIDNMSTAIMMTTGQAKGDKKVFKGKMPVPQIGEYVPSKMVETAIDEDTFMLEAYMPGPDGEMFMHMRLSYHRVVGAE